MNYNCSNKKNILECGLAQFEKKKKNSSGHVPETSNFLKLGKGLFFTNIYRYLSFIFLIICDVLRDLVPFVQFKKCEKHPWMGCVTLVKPATLLKVTLHTCFSHFL